VLNHLEREAFYGVAATQSVGSSPTEQALRFQQDQRDGKFPAASRFLFMPGMAPPNGGPDAVLLKGTTALRAVYEVTTAAEARAAIQTMARRKLESVKIWVDDRRGTYPKMTPEVYNAIIDEAHKHRMMVHAHATTLADQKAVVRAGADALVHTVANEKLDEELGQPLSRLCGPKREFCTRFDVRISGLGAPQARPPERSGATGPRERRRGGSAGAKPPGSS
jgi:hypothetical protein